MTESEMIILRSLANSADIEPVNDSIIARSIVDGMKIIGDGLNRYLDGKEIENDS